MLDQCDGDEGRAAEALQTTLIGQDAPEVKIATLESRKCNSSELSLKNEKSFDRSTRVDILSNNQDGGCEQATAWAEEQETLQAIYGERFTAESASSCRIALDIVGSKNLFEVHLRQSSSYPTSPPVLYVTRIKLPLPAHVRLSIVRQALEFAQQDLLGQPMIYNIVEWLEANIQRVLENPGKLRNVAAAAPVVEKANRPPKLQRPRALVTSKPLNKQPASSESLALLKKWNDRQNDPRQQELLLGRKALPAWSLQDSIVRAVNENQVTIISGETGSGKSTQSVQFVLDDLIRRKLGAAANIVCTQPRRISALGLADRVSEERCSKVGEEVGYSIRGESRQKPGITKITFVTTGVLLRRMQTSGGSIKDVIATLAEISHIFVDEVHERSLDTDFLLVLMRDVLRERKDLKVILMSATLDAAIFENYFAGTSQVAKVEIQGRTFPVEDFYLDDVIQFTGFIAGMPDRKPKIHDWDEDDSSVASTIQGIGAKINYELIATTVRAIDEDMGSQSGGILIFLPGTMEINRTMEAVMRLPNIHALPLHASLTSVEQRRVFPSTPRGKRKVIAATNVAETSITIEDIVVVIDLGKVKETSYDAQNNMVKLEEVWASRAACKQRRGRAGRVQAGKCYKLYTRNAEAKMAERPQPEIRRVQLEQLCLSVRAMGVEDVPGFLASALTPPEDLAVEGAIRLLGRMGALDGNQLTALGQHLSMIPADLRCGKLMVYGATFGCLEACLTIAAILTVKSPFFSPQNQRDESKAARSAFAPDQGDMLCDLRAFEAWSIRRSRSSYQDIRAWCDQNFLSANILHDIANNRDQYLSSLTDAGFLPQSYRAYSDSLNTQNANSALIRALIAGAFNPQLARIDFPDKKYAPSMSGAVELDPEARAIKFSNQDNGRVFLHPGSTLFGAQGFVGGSTYMSYFNKMATSKVFIREVTRKYTLLWTESHHSKSNEPTLADPCPIGGSPFSYSLKSLDPS